MYCGGSSATTTPYSPPVEEVQLSVQSAHASQLEERVWVTLPVKEQEVGISFKEMGQNIGGIAYDFADVLWLGVQSLGHVAANNFSVYSMYEPVYHFDGRLATMQEEVEGVLSLGLTVGGGVIGRAAGAGVSRLLNMAASRFSLFSRSAGAALEAATALEVPVAARTGAQLLNDGFKLLPEATPPNLGQGTIFTHFTNAEGITGITGVQGSSLSVGQTVTVAELRFGTGSNSFLAARSSDLFVTDLGVNATSGQLNAIGVFSSTGKQNFAILFSQESALYNGIRPTLMRESIFTIPGNTTLNGEFLLLRIR